MTNTRGNFDASIKAWQALSGDAKDDLCRNGGCTACRFGNWYGGSSGSY